MQMSQKSPDVSKAEMIVRTLPSDANPAGNVFGGEILKQIDLVAGLVGQRHCQKNTVTASMDQVNFLKPVFVGNALILSARLTYTHHSSMEVEIKVEAEDMEKGTRTVTGTAYVTLVALDSDGKPSHVPELYLKTDEDRKKFQEGKTRMQRRISDRNSR